jgi:hypothetical protein
VLKGDAMLYTLSIASSVVGILAQVGGITYALSGRLGTGQFLIVIGMLFVVLASMLRIEHKLS